MLYNLFIGSNNVSHVVELDKIKEIVGSEFEGFTLIDSVGLQELPSIAFIY